MARCGACRCWPGGRCCCAGLWCHLRAACGGGVGRGSRRNRVCRRRQRPRGQFPDCNRCTLRHYLVTALRRPQARSCPMAEHDGQLNHSADSAPFPLAGFDPRQIRPRLPAPWQARFAPAQAGAAGLLASGLGMAPCLRACALRQSDRENAPPERFRAVLWGRKAGGRRGDLKGAFAGYSSSASSLDNVSAHAPACIP